MGSKNGTETHFQLVCVILLMTMPLFPTGTIITGGNSYFTHLTTQLTARLERFAREIEKNNYIP